MQVHAPAPCGMLATMSIFPRVVLALALTLAALEAGCRSRGAAAAGSDDARAAPPEPSASALSPPVALPLPGSVDLRPRLYAMGLAPRPQGRRGTCSIFTTCVALEFALAVQAEAGGASGPAARLSPEYLNWAGAQVVGHPCDGNFFHNAVAGFERWGLCTDASMPYAEAYDPARAPSAAAAEEARAVRERALGRIAIRWIVPWTPGRFGVDDAQFAEIKGTLARGYPVAAGSGHSRLLVGYRDDANTSTADPHAIAPGATDAPAPATGGGVFLTLDSALNRFAEVPYTFVRKDVADVFWVEFVERAEKAWGSRLRPGPYRLARK